MSNTKKTEQLFLISYINWCHFHKSRPEKEIYFAENYREKYMEIICLQQNYRYVRELECSDMVQYRLSTL